MPPPPRRHRRTKTDEQDARLARAFEASQDLFFLSTPVDALEFVMRLLKELIPCEASSACLYDINTDEFRFVALDGPGGDERRSEAVPRDTGIMGAAVRTEGVALRVTDASSDEHFDPGVDGRLGIEARTILYYPLNHQGRLLGMLQLINRAKKPHFTSADGDVVTYVGKQVAEFLYRARLKPDQMAGTTSR